MKVFALFSDGSCCEVVLELCAPDASGDPVRANVVGARDTAVTTSAERAVKVGYFLLRQWGFDPEKLRYFASFDMNLPAGTPFSGDSAGLAFLVKFLCAILEKESGKSYDHLTVAATGVIPRAEAETPIEAVQHILPKLLGAMENLPEQTQYLIPEANIAEMENSGDIHALKPGLTHNLKSMRHGGEVMDWINGIIPFQQHLPDSTQVKPAPSASSVSSGLWIKRMALYACAFLIAPVLSLALRPEKPVPPEPTPDPAPRETPIAPTPEVSPLVQTKAPPLASGYVQFEPRLNAPARKISLLSEETTIDLGAVSGRQIAFRDIALSDDAYLYLMYFAPQEQALYCLFPDGQAYDSDGNAAPFPLPAGRAFHFPGPAEAYPLTLPEELREQQEFFFLIWSSRKISRERRLISGESTLPDFVQTLNDAIVEGNKVRARALLRIFLQYTQSPPEGVRVLTVRYQHQSRRTED